MSRNDEVRVEQGNGREDERGNNEGGMKDREEGLLSCVGLREQRMWEERE